MQEIVVISDCHIARVWDKIKKVYPDEYVNPNENLREFLKGVLDEQLLVINGDLVDYYYADRKTQKDNWDLFHEILSVRKGETFLTLGNHDYRKTPYNFWFYRLSQVGIPWKKQKQYADAIGYHKFLGFKELECLRVNPKWFNALKKHKMPRYYSRTLKDRELIFLETGPDSLTKIGNWWKWPLVLAPHVSSDGLTKEQLELVKMRLASTGPKDVVIFAHAPPFSSKRTARSVQLGGFLYGWRLLWADLINGTFVNNNWAFMKLLAESEKNVVVVSSHIHTPKQYVFDKRSKIVRQSDIDEINKLKDDERYVKLLTTLPMGTLKSHWRKTGYLILGDKISYHVMHDFGKDL